LHNAPELRLTVGAEGKGCLKDADTAKGDRALLLATHETAPSARR